MPYLRDTHNQYGTPVSMHRCDGCGFLFTVCPPAGDSWGGCLGEDCASYDITRDIDLFWDCWSVEKE